MSMAKKLFNKTEYTSLRQKLRNSMTKSETVLWTRLKGNQLGWKFRRQHGIGPYVADFFCPELQLVIEIDGISHESEQQSNYDKTRQDFFKKQGFEVLRFITDEILHELDRVVENIHQECKRRAAIKH
jgi:very-short-patch-repair endonuclease